MHRRGIALLIALLGIVALFTIVQRSLVRMERQVSELANDTHLLQTKALAQDVKKILDEAKSAYGIATPDELLGAFGAFPSTLPLGEGKVEVKLESAYGKLDVALLADQNGTNGQGWFEMVRLMAQENGVSDVSGFLTCLAMHKPASHQILQMCMREHERTMQDPNIWKLKRFLGTTTHLGTDEEARTYLEDLYLAVHNSGLSVAPINNTYFGEGVKERQTKVACEVRYIEGDFHSNVRFLYDLGATQKDANATSFEVSF